MKLMLAFVLGLATISAFAQNTTFTRVSQDNLASIQLGMPDCKSSEGWNSITGTQTLTLTLKDETKIVLHFEGRDGNNYPSCARALREVNRISQELSLQLFSIMQGDVEVSVTDSVAVCTKKALDVLFMYGKVAKYEVVKLQSVCR